MTKLLKIAFFFILDQFSGLDKPSHSFDVEEAA
jgi:hypothetical protein